MLTIKVFDIPTKLHKCNLPFNIVEHCNQYKDTYTRHASTFAWMCLSKYIDLRKVKFTQNGKPYIVGIKKYFSLSHSFDKVAIAICDKPIGIDIEKTLPLGIASSLASRVLKGRDLTSYHNAKDQSLWFTKYWTKYEAFNKLKGDKLTLKSFGYKIKNKTITKTIRNKQFVLTYILKKKNGE
ncbi:MAG: 4'-phosphopantetheinyl transferase family protein [Mycoplasmoidaceae bacterium]